MRNCLCLSITLCLFVGIGEQGRADDRDTALRVINQAIEAHGGAAGLAKSHIRTRSARGIQFFPDREVPFTTELTMDLPERLRDSIEVQADGGKSTVLQLLNGNQGWRNTGGSTIDMTKEEVADLREEAYILWLTTLVPLKDTSFDLAPLPEVKINDRPAVGVKVAAKGHADCNLWFDKLTGLLVKAEHQGRVSGLQVSREYLFSDFKGFGGLKLAGKETELINGSKSTELSIGACSFPDKLEDSQFGKP